MCVRASLCLSPVKSCDGAVRYVAVMSEEERDWKTFLLSHCNWGPKTWLICALPLCSHSPSLSLSESVGVFFVLHTCEQHAHTKTVKFQVLKI